MRCAAQFCTTVQFKKRKKHPSRSFFKLGFTPCKAEQPLQGIELQEKEVRKD